MIIAGIDEAGYGPLLGPLVVSCAALEVPAAAVAAGLADCGGANAAAAELPLEVEALPCLWRLLKGGVARKAGPKTKGRIVVADSKVIHALTDGLKLLERGVLSFAGQLPREDQQALSGLRLMALLGCADHGLAEQPWYGTVDAALPRWCEPGDLAIATNMLGGALARSGVRVAGMRTAVVPEQTFNRLVTGTNNKASALVSVTLRHLYWLHTNFGSAGLAVGVDKQGGRDHYTNLLLQSFPEAQLRVLQEGEAGSTYLLTESGTPGRRTVIHFREKGETHFLPTALASMACKYLREMCMASFNDWWCGKIAGLRPTAGYYQDGMRWLQEVEPQMTALGVRREMLVRCR